MRPPVWFARHAQTALGSLGRIVGEPAAAVMTVGVIAIAVTMPLLLYVLLANVRDATATLDRGTDLSVYLTTGTPAGRVRALAEQMRARSDVAAVRVITAAEGLAEFRRYSGFGDALDALTDNPLPDTLIVTPNEAASTSAGVERLRQFTSGLPDVQRVQADSDWIKRLDALQGVLRRVAQLTGLLFAVGVALVVGNTIRLDILNRRAEIEVLKLVGATDSFARRPFLYSGVWYGFGGGMGAVLLVAVALAGLGPPVGRLAAAYGATFQLSGLGIRTILSVVGGCMVLAWSGAFMASTRLIKAIEPL